MANFDKADLQWILQQILMAEAGQEPVNPHLPFGLRQVAGTDNNLVTGQAEFGAADETFPRIGAPIFLTAEYGTGYDQTAVDASINPMLDPVGSGTVIDSLPRLISNLISDQSAANPAALEAYNAFLAQLGDGYSVLPTNPVGTDSLFIGNITPDAGLSAPFNTWMTLFGQFFDHGLDLVSKGGSGTVLIPLMSDDPLYDPASPTNFMVLTRSTNQPGADGILGTADDVHEHINTTTPFVDQNQTYASHPSHQAFLRDYMIGADGALHSTGKLLEGRSAGDDGRYFTADDVVNRNMATWSVVKSSAAQKLGVLLDDRDVGDVPLLVTDDYGNLVLDAQGRIQIVVDVARTLDGVTTVSQHVVKASAASPVDIHALSTDQVLSLVPVVGATYTVSVVRTGHAFLNDIAHNAVPVADANGNLLADTDAVAGNVIVPDTHGNNPFYDNELLDAHYIAGDGRVNENIGLIAVHEVFHNEHNRLIEQIKDVVRAELASGDTSFATDWVLTGSSLADGIQDNEWNGERLFQAAKFGTETQYQHLVFEEFARKIAPSIHLFGNVDINLDPAITAEFAHAVYRFGHSMLDETLPRFEIDPTTGTPLLDANGQPILNDIGLIEAFLNPLAYAAAGDTAAAQIAAGAVHQIGNEIDEFVTGALRNNLLGLPLDLAALNIARGRDTGVPTLNLLRAELFDITNDTALKPYASWHELGQFLKHEGSLINFVAAYGQHELISGATTALDKRVAALALVIAGETEANKTAADGSFERDAYDFIHSLGRYSNNRDDVRAIHDIVDGDPTHVPTWSTGSVTGVDRIDLWIGGLAEKQSLFGGLLGSTFNFIFETQLESLQDGDRLYYLPRIEGLHWGSEIEANSFAEMISRNTGANHLPASIFLVPEYVVEASQVTADPSTWLRNPITGKLLVERLDDGTVHFIGDDNFFGNTIVLGGTEGADRLISGHADDDTVWADGGDDYIDGGNGNDFLYGGTGNDTIRDSGGDDVIHGDEGDDDIDGGIGADIIFGGAGNDILRGGAGIDVISGGLGNDVILGGEDDDELTGNEGDDWIEGGGGGDLVVGDQGAPTGMLPLITGNDVLDGGAMGDRMLAFSGDDIMLGEGGFDKFDGGLGFDWASFMKESHGVSVDMRIRELVPDPLAPDGGAVRDTFVQTEGLSGTRYDDVLIGTDVGVANNLGVVAPDTFNMLQNVSLISGLAAYFPEAFPVGGIPGPVAFSNGNIILGGDGNDRITGGGGNDIIDGDAYLNVRLEQTVAGVQIVREILTDATPGDVDTAVFRGLSTDYEISLLTDADGNPIMSSDSRTAALVVSSRLPANGNGGNVVNGVNVVPDGTDVLYNIERIEFADTTVENFFVLGGFNHIPLGSVLIQGDTNVAVAGVDPLVGSLLTADVTTDEIYDPDGFGGPLRFQWQYLEPIKGRWVDIAGATSQSFSPTTFVNTNALRVAVSFTDGLGYTEVVHSAATNAVSLPPGVNTAPFVVQQQGQLGFPNTSVLQGGDVAIFLPLTTAFGDQQTPANQLIYKAELVSSNGTAQLLDGTAAARGLLFTVLTDATGAVTGGAITGTLPDSVVAPLSIRITATDRGPGTALTATTAFALTVTAVNHAPQAELDLYLAQEDDRLIVGAADGVLANDLDVDGNPLVAQLLTGVDLSTGLARGPDHGTIVLNDDGSFSYTPFAGFAGEDYFTYRAFDGRLASADTEVRITVNSVNDGAATLQIAGVAAVGEVLSAVLGSDPDGEIVSEVLYQWYVGSTPIAGATQSTFEVTAAQASTSGTPRTISVTAAYVDAQGFQEVVSSAPTDPVGVIITSNATSTVGTAGADRLTGGGAANSISGGAGGDVIFGLGGADILDGQGGDDWIEGGGGSDSLTGGAGNDTLIGGAGSDTVNGGAGSDVIRYTIGDGGDTISGGGDVDIVEIAGTTANETINLTLDAQQRVSRFIVSTVTSTVSGVEFAKLDMGLGTDTLAFTSAAGVTVDLVSGVATGLLSITGVENVTGGSGDDTFILADDGVRNIINGGNGSDTVDLSAFSRALNVSLSGATLSIVGGTDDQLRNVENMIAGAGDDRLAGDGAANILRGGAGNDSISGGAGNDELHGGAGNDTLQGGAGNDKIAGGANNDRILYTFGDGADTIDGGGDIDTLQITAGGGGDTLRVGLNANGGTLISFDARINGAGGAIVSTVDNVESISFDLGGGSDTIDYSSNSIGVFVDLVTGSASGFASITNVENVIGGSSSDRFVAGVNNIRNAFTGGSGADTIDYSAYSSDLTVTLNGNVAVVVAGSGAQNNSSDTISGIENFIGGAGSDRITGDGAANVLSGGAGNDTLAGGAGADVFVFASGFGADVISDFRAGSGAGHDVLQISMGQDYTTFDDLNPIMSQIGASTVLIEFDPDHSVTLRNTTLVSLTAADFAFV